MICNKCGYDNNNDANFCESCGEQLIANKGENKPKKNYRKNPNRYRKQNESSPIKLFWTVALLVIAGLLIYSIINTNSSRDYKPAPTANDFRSGNSVVEANVYEIASKFICGCGSCGEESLEKCDCGFAVQEKQFIRNLVQQGSSSKNIIAAVDNKYGGLKSSFSNKSDLPSININPGNEIAVIATYNDRTDIYSKFICPCGQCGIDELKDCVCNHPKGAIEVKSFIDSQIAQNKYSVDEIIAQVADKYGGKKD